MRAIRGQVYGFVQGVGFRYYTRMMADRYGVVGWVKNRMDGSVEVFAQGPADAIKSFESYLGEGPPSARVERTHFRPSDPDPACRSFDVR